MCKMFIFRKIIFVTAFLFLNAVISFAQNNPKVDSILKQAKLSVYDNPNRVIRIGDSIYNSPTTSLSEKVDALMIVSVAYSSKRDYQKSLKYFQIANDLTKKDNNVELQITVLSRTAVRYQQMKMYDKAIQCMDECDALIAKNHLKNSSISFTKANNYLVRGFIYKEQLSCDIAISYFDKGIEQYKSIKSSVKQANLSIAYYNKGNCYVILSDFKAAKQSFLDAISYAEDVHANSLKAFAQKGLAEVYSNQKDHIKAIEILNEAFKNSKGVGDLILNKGIYSALSNNYLALNDLVQYEKYNRLFLKNQAIIKESERTSVNDSIDELVADNAQKLSDERVKYFSFIAVISGLIFVSLFVLYMYQKRSIKSIEMLNNEVSRIKTGLRNNNLT